MEISSATDLSHVATIELQLTPVIVRVGTKSKKQITLLMFIALIQVGDGRIAELSIRLHD